MHPPDCFRRYICPYALLTLVRRAPRRSRASGVPHELDGTELRSRRRREPRITAWASRMAVYRSLSLSLRVPSTVPVSILTDMSSSGCRHLETSHSSIATSMYAPGHLHRCERHLQNPDAIFPATRTQPAAPDSASLPCVVLRFTRAGPMDHLPSSGGPRPINSYPQGFSTRVTPFSATEPAPLSSAPGAGSMSGSSVLRDTWRSSAAPARDPRSAAGERCGRHSTASGDPPRRRSSGCAP